MDITQTNKDKIKFTEVFNFKDPDARARVCILFSTSLQTLLAYVITGIFFTGFISEYGMDIIDSNILSFIPYLAGLFVIVTPGLLSHFPKRKWILSACNLLYYAFNLVAITLLPEFVKGSAARLWGLIILTFVANVVNVIAVAGYAAWHVRFMPERIRSYFLSASQISAAAISGIFALTSGWISDSLEAMEGGQLTFLIVLRYVAFGIGILDCILVCIPHEVEYPVIHSPKVSDIILIPLHNKKFTLTMVIVFLWRFGTCFSAASLAYYLLNTINMSYTYYNFIVFLYAVIFILCSSFWQKMIKKTSWLLVFAIGMFIVGPTQIVYGFVQPDHYIILVLVVRVLQHFAGAGHNVVYSNLQYLNMPITNRTCYSSFFTVVQQVSSLLGAVAGIWFLKLTEDFTMTLFGYTYTSGVPLTIIISGIIFLATGLYIIIFRKKLEPDKDEIRA